jgi:phthalate 4,5-dioxygenase oxygenase subunit
MNVPVDDHHTAFHFMAWGSPETTPDSASWRAFLHAEVGPDLDAQFHPKRTHANFFGQDRVAMKAGNFTGIQGIPNQDMAMWVSMGPIVDRTNDRLGASDMAIVEFRQRMLKAVRDFMASNKQPPALGLSEEERLKLASWERIVPKSIDWRDFDHAAGKLAAE